MNNRSANVELTRFISIVAIMASHIYVMNISGAELYPFNSAWIFVELFLIITGYYTARHFNGRVAGNKLKDGFIYTYQKFIRLIPYTTIVTILAWLTEGAYCVIYDSENYNLSGYLVSYYSDFTFDILLLSAYRPLVAPLWYLSATLIVFPLLTLIVQIRDRYLLMFISLTYAYMYHSIIGFDSGTNFPNCIPRALAGLLLGVFIYECTYVFGNIVEKFNKGLLTFIEVFSFLCVILGTYKNWNTGRFFVLMFCIFTFIMLPGMSYTQNIKSKFISYLGRLSMPLFIFHWYIGSTINKFKYIYLWNETTSLVLYYSVSFVVSIIVLYLIEHWKWFQNFIKKNIELKD